MTKEEKIELFKYELSLIKDNGLREFAKALLENTDDWFYSIPASTSGKYHPDFDRVEGGLVNHTKAVVYFVDEFAKTDMFNVNEHQADILKVGAIAHDIRKIGDGKTGHTVKNHPELAGDFIRSMYVEHSNLLSQEDVMYMCKAVEAHMGKWHKPVPSTDSEKLLHLADFVASRDRLSAMKFPTEVEQAVEQPTNMVTFGKYKGKTFEEVYRLDGKYLEWVANAEDFFNKDVQNKVKLYLIEQSK